MTERCAVHETTLAHHSQILAELRSVPAQLTLLQATVDRLTAELSEHRERVAWPSRSQVAIVILGAIVSIMSGWAIAHFPATAPHAATPQKAP